MVERAELDRALAKIGVEAYLDREGVNYHPSYGTRGLQLNLDECPVCGSGGRKTYINAETGLGNCFHGSCGFKFNKFKLIRAVSGLSGGELMEHISAVAEEQGWMPKREAKVIERGDLKLPSKLLPAVGPDGRLLAYLAGRGITPETATWFNLSYCNGGWWGYKLADGEERWVSYSKRIIIPIADMEGKLVSFQGRDTTGKLEPKYLFPAGFAVAGSHLYNGFNFVEGETTHAIVGEGAFDAWSIHQAIEDKSMLALATFGMHLSGGPDGQLAKFARLKERGLKIVTMMWDAEKAAMKMAVTAGLQLTGLGLVVRIAQLPDGKDPNEVEPEVVRKAIYEATRLDRLSAIRLLSHASALS